MTKSEKCHIIRSWKTSISKNFVRASLNLEKELTMRKKKNKIIGTKVIFFIALLILTNGYVIPCSHGEKAKDIQGVSIDFDTRIKFYLDLKTKRFLNKMALKEEILVSMIRNLTSEVQARGKSGIAEGDDGFGLVYSKSDNILKQYETEIQSIKNVVTEVEQLELTIQKMDDLKLLDEVEQLKDHLMTVLDEQKLSTGQLTKQQVANMIQKYSGEVSNILKIYESIDYFQKRAAAVGDVEIVKQLDQQKQRIMKVLEESRITGPASDKVVESYIEEAVSIVDILKKIDVLQGKAASDTSLNLDIEGVRNNIVSNIDKRVLELFGYLDNEDFKGTTVSEYFRIWKSERVTEYQVKYTNYRIIRDNLIKTATSSERNRMLEREITDALLNYANQNYELAEMQFQQIYSAYKDYYPALDAVIFYKSEANFANHYFDDAQAGYLNIINNYPNSQYLGQCYLRLMIISYTYGWNSEFFKYFDKVKDFITVDREDFNKANYLAAYLYVQKNQFEDARTVLENIKDVSKYYIPAQYLLGIVLLNLEKSGQAQSVFEKIVDQENYPWTDLKYSIFRNESLLKLGYLRYQRGEYDKAIFYFDQVSKGYENYDASLLGQAWASLKTGQYDNAINKVDVICNNYLLSNYMYEALVLSAQCKRIQKRSDEAMEDLRYVANAKHVLNKVEEYNEERKHLLTQLDELDQLEEKVIEHQDKKLYPQVVKIRDLIGDALLTFRYRGAVSSRFLEEYNDERKVLIQQIEEFESIIKYAKEQGNEAMLADALKQRSRLISVLEKYQLNYVPSGVSYFLDYPLATKEGGIIYRRGIITKLMSNMVFEKQRVQQDLGAVTQLMNLSNEKTSIEAAIDLEIIEEDLKDLNNQLNQFQVWLADHDVEDVKMETDKWANLSGFGMSDINFVSYRERVEKIGGYQKNLALIDDVLQGKRQQLEQRIRRFDDEVKKIEREIEAEKIRLEKLEKEKYFQDIYFETKTRETETEEIENYDENLWLNDKQSGK